MLFAASWAWLQANEMTTCQSQAQSQFTGKSISLRNPWVRKLQEFAGQSHPKSMRPVVLPLFLVLNLDDLVVPDREIEDEEQMSTRVHRSHSFVVFRHCSDEGNPADVTGKRTPIEVPDGRPRQD